MYGHYYLLTAPELNVGTDVNELRGLINTYSGRKHLKTILTKEIQYQRITHQRDATVRHELYLVKSLTVQKMTDNLSLLLGSDSDAAEEVVVFPCENQNMATLKHACHHQHISSIAFFAVIWDNGDSRCVCAWSYFKSGMEGDPLLKRANRSNDIVSQ